MPKIRETDGKFKVNKREECHNQKAKKMGKFKTGNWIVIIIFILLIASMTYTVWRINRKPFNPGGSYGRSPQTQPGNAQTHEFESPW